MSRTAVAGFVALAVLILVVLAWSFWPPPQPEPNQPAQAVVTATATEGQAPFDAAFDASESSDPDGEITSYTWDFGDGQTGEGLRVEHTYEHSGIFTARLTVSDDLGNSHAAEEPIRVTLPSPSGIGLESEDGKVMLRWKSVEGADSYNLYWSQGASASPASGEKIAEISQAKYEKEQKVPPTNGIEDDLAARLLIDDA